MKLRKTILSQSGNLMLALFAAVGAVAMLGSVYMGVLQGPVRSLDTNKRMNIVENDLLVAPRLLLAGTAEQQDCDGDGVVEPMPFRALAGGITGGGAIPMTSSAAKKDPWGSEYGYCVWDHGKKTVSDAVPECGGAGVNRLPGGETGSEYVMAIVSAGPDKVFQTVCNPWVDADGNGEPDQPLIVTPPGSDDIVRASNMQTLLASGVAQLQSHPDDACNESTIGLLRYFEGTMQVCTEDGWVEVGASIVSSGMFDPHTGVEINTQRTSNQIAFSGFYGTRKATATGGAVIVVNGIERGASTDIKPGDQIALRATSSATPEQTTSYTLRIGIVERAWSITTRNFHPANLTITPVTKTGMDVVGPGNPAYGSVVGFIVRNIGELPTPAFSASLLSNTTNFQFHSGGSYGGDDCATRILAPNGYCTIDIRPRATTGGSFAGTLRARAGALSAEANLSGNATKFSCAIWGQTVPDTHTVTAYQTANVAFGVTCSSQLRRCENGTLTGTYMHETCSPPSELVVTVNSTVNLVLQNLYTSAEWTSTTPKRVVIASGAVIGSNSASLPALRTGTGWGSTLTLENNGSIRGAGGAANGGTGGTAILAEANGLTLRNNGTIYAGGGGGGRGGTGGNGTYTATERQPASGEYYIRSGSTYYYHRNGSGNNSWLYWAGKQTWISGAPNSYTTGGWTYRKGSYKTSEGWFGSQVMHAIWRSRNVSASSSGGAGGNGGRGRGHDGAAATGAAGANGGTSAGRGGTGGTGGGWGEAGAKGATGANGNASNGSGGAAGGQAGWAVQNPTRVTITVTGTILGRR